MPEQRQKQKTSYNNSNSDFDNNDLTITHDVIAPSIDDILASVRAALEGAQKTIDEQGGGSCGCF